MAIAFTNLGASTTPDINSATNATSYASGSWTPPTTGVVAVWIYSRNNTGIFANPTLSGNGMTWTFIGRQDDGGSNFDAIWLYAAPCIASPTTGATTVDFGVTQASCVAEFFQITGGNLRRPNGILDMFQNFKTQWGSTGTANTVTFDAAEHADNRPIFCSYHATNEATTFRTNWTELDDLGGTANPRGVESQVRSDTFETTGSASWTTSSARGCFGAEVVSDTAPTAFTKTVSNTVGFTDSLAKVAAFFKTISNTIGLTDLVAGIGSGGGTDWTKAITDTVGFTDTLIKVAHFFKSISNTLGLTDLVAGVLTQAQNWVYAISDTVGFTDSLRKAFIVVSRTILNGVRALSEIIRGSIK